MDDEKLFQKRFTRRDFLKKTARAGVGAGVGLAALGSIRIGFAEKEEGEAYRRRDRLSRA